MSLAGEALGAIGCSSVINILDEYAKDPVPEVSFSLPLPSIYTFLGQVKK